jgi:hypothetical protein
MFSQSIPSKKSCRVTIYSVKAEKPYSNCAKHKEIGTHPY